MKGRLFAIALLFGAVGTAASWLVLWPLLRLLTNIGGAEVVQELSARMKVAAPALLFLDLVVLSVAAWLILYWSVGRPLRRTEEALEQLEHLKLELPFDEPAGPLLSRVQLRLRRTAEALRREQAKTQQQLTALQAANEQLSAAQGELVRSEQLALLGRVAAGVAHEVGNPLTGILGYLSLLKEKDGQGEEVKRYASLIEAEVQRIDGIVRSLLELGRPASPVLSNIDVEAAVRGAVELMRGRRDFSGIELRTDVPAGLSAKADRGILAQVLLNLLLNAAQAMGGKGHIRISGERDGETVRLHVDDDGPGLTPEAQRRLFEPFFTTKQAGKGTGLGLAVSQQQLHALRGALRARNREDGGARFTVELPAA